MEAGGQWNDIQRSEGGKPVNQGNSISSETILQKRI